MEAAFTGEALTIGFNPHLSRTRTELEWSIAGPAHVARLSFEKVPT
jgi:hypothetical protein